MINHYVHFSRLVQGFWRANEWKMTAKELNYFINELVERGITTMDHADIYGDYQCESLFGNALDLSPELRKFKLLRNVVSFCLLSNLILQMDIVMI